MKIGDRVCIVGDFVVSFDPDAPRCGRDCTCCEDDDGIAPGDHEPGCRGIGGERECACGAAERAAERHREAEEVSL